MISGSVKREVPMTKPGSFLKGLKQAFTANSLPLLFAAFFFVLSAREEKLEKDGEAGRN